MISASVHRGIKLPSSQNTGFARRCNCQASATDTSATLSCSEAISTLKEATKSFKVPSKELTKALRTVQKENVPREEWLQKIACNELWRLVYVIRSDAVRANNKDPETGTGFYFPATATNKLQLTDAENSKGRISTAIHIPHIAALEVSGDFNMPSKLLEFDINELKVKLGPFKLGPIQIPSAKKGDSGPFFNFFYVDEDILCGLGRSGGIALWAKAEPTFVAEKALDL